VSGGNSAQQPQRAVASLTRGGTGGLLNRVATGTTLLLHGLAKGQPVMIAGARIGGQPAPANTYNGSFGIDSVPSPTSFTYVMTTAPSANADASPAPTFGALWQVGRLILEHNVTELVLPIGLNLDPPVGVWLQRTASTPAAPVSPYVFKHVIIRGNLIRHVNNASDPAGEPVSLALNLASCEGLIVEENVIKLDRASAIELRDCGAMKCFNNQASSGKLIQGYDATRERFLNELETDVDLGTILAT
jgi:hypothetical protein